MLRNSKELTKQKFPPRLSSLKLSVNGQNISHILKYFWWRSHSQPDSPVHFGAISFIHTSIFIFDTHLINEPKISLWKLDSFGDNLTIVSQLCRSSYRFNIAGHSNARQGTPAVAMKHWCQVCIERTGYKQCPLPAKIRKEMERGCRSILQALPWILTVRAGNS
jgi:hypothetical protein